MAISAAMKPLNPPTACGTRSGEVGPRAGCRSKAKRGHDQNQNALEHREDKLEIAGLLDAQIIQPGHEPRDRDGKHLRPQQRKRARNRRRRASETPGNTPSVRARPLVTAAIDAGLATANQVHM